MSFRRNFCVCSCFVIVTAGPALRAQAPAQSSASSSSSSSKSSKQARKPSPGADSPLEAGTVSNGTYRNTTFAFTCKIPVGWVLRTDEMNTRDDGSEAAQDSAKAGRVLLAAYSRPPEARGDDVNGSIVIAAESAAAIPGLKEAAQYFVLVNEAAKAQGLEMDDEPYDFVVGTKTLVRGDFQKDVGTRVLRQSTLVMLARGYVVSITFIGGTEDEVEELVQGLSFVTPQAK